MNSPGGQPSPLPRLVGSVAPPQAPAASYYFYGIKSLDICLLPTGWAAPRPESGGCNASAAAFAEPSAQSRSPKFPASGLGIIHLSKELIFIPSLWVQCAVLMCIITFRALCPQINPRKSVKIWRNVNTSPARYGDYCEAWNYSADIHTRRCGIVYTHGIVSTLWYSIYSRYSIYSMV